MSCDKISGSDPRSPERQRMIYHCIHRADIGPLLVPTAELRRKLCSPSSSRLLRDGGRRCRPWITKCLKRAVALNPPGRMSFRALRQSFQIWNFVSFRIRFVPDFAYEMIFIADNYYFSRLIFINDGSERGSSSSSYAEQSSSTGDSLAAAGPSRPVKPVPSCRRCRGNRFPSVPRQ